MRVLNIILTKLAYRKLELEQMLEEAINSDKNIEVKSEEIDDILEKLAVQNLKMKTWQEYMPAPPEVDNNEENKEDNGTVQ